MITAILFILMMLVLVIPHELGHFIVAKLCGVQVNEFSVGMGPLLFKKQHGETQYSVRLFPLGGYCAMEGENGDDGEGYNPRAFINKKWWQKLAVLVAGVVMNVICAVIILTISYSIAGVPTTTLGEVTSGMPAAEAGIQAGDRIVRIDGTEINSWEDVNTAGLKFSKDKAAEIIVVRDDTELTFNLYPQWSEKYQSWNLGIVAGQSRNPARCLQYGAKGTWRMNKMMLSAFGGLLKKGISRGDIAGPVGIVRIVNQTKSYGITAYLSLLALVSLNLALMNILPFPALDGGRILFVIIRMITGNRISDEMEATFHFAGMVLLIALMLFITFGDIRNLFT